MRGKGRNPLNTGRVRRTSDSDGKRFDVEFHEAGIPACMFWPIPTPGMNMEEWQLGRCAVCEGRGGGRGLYRDHDHITGLMRGLLCPNCNTLEGFSARPMFVRYRAGWNPAALLGINEEYVDAG